MDEELLFCDRKILLLREYMQKFEEDRKNGGKYLVLICKCLYEGRISRRSSDIRGYWCYNMKNKDEGMSDKEYFKKFVECFERKDDECFKWMFKIFDGNKKGDVVRFRRKDNIYMIWEYLFNNELVKKNKYINKVLNYKLVEFYKLGRGERFMFLVNSIDLVMKYSNSNEECENKYRELLKKYRKENVNIKEIMKKSAEYLQMDDYVVDMHTSEGRKRVKVERILHWKVV